LGEAPAGLIRMGAPIDEKKKRRLIVNALIDVLLDTFVIYFRKADSKLLFTRLTFAHGFFYVIPNSFHPLLSRIHKIIRKTRLDEFWLGVWKKYHGHAAVVLSQSKIEWIIKTKVEGKRNNEEIARVQEISVRRVQQLYAQYKSAGTIPVLKESGRPRSEISVYERRAILDAFQRWGSCACYLEEMLSASGVDISHRKIHRVLREEGPALDEPHKKRRRKWIRYEREHSNSLWHTDWHKIKDPRWQDSGSHATRMTPLASF
jgi:transposase